MKKCVSLFLSVLILLSFPMIALAEPEGDFEDRTINMTITYEDGEIIADLEDSSYGTVSNWPVTLKVNGETYETKNTDYEGLVVFDTELPADARDVSLVAHDGQVEAVRLIGCEMFVDIAPVTTTTQTAAQAVEGETTVASDSAASSTTIATVPTTTTNSLVVSPNTTKVKDDLISVGVDADRSLLSAMQITDDDFVSRARMWVKKDCYQDLVDLESSTIHLQLNLNTEAGTLDRLLSAKNADSTYASYEDSTVKGFAMDTGLYRLDKSPTGELSHWDLDAYLSDEANRDKYEYKIELPLPAYMKSCEKIAVAVCTEDGLSRFVEVTPKNDMLCFDVRRFQTLAIVGFGHRTQTPALLNWLIVGGIVLVILGVLLLVIVPFRRKKAEKAQKHGERRVMFDAVKEHELEDRTEEPQTKEQSVLMEYDEQSALTEDQREVYRAKDNNSKEAIESIAVKSVSPALQQEAAPVFDVVDDNDSDKTRSVDEMLDDVLNDLEDMDC